jgi:CBS domain-containing protein
MREKGVRRLPVIDRTGHLIGIVALDDLVAVLADELYDIVGVVVHGRSREAATRR